MSERTLSEALEHAELAREMSTAADDWGAVDLVLLADEVKRQGGIIERLLAEPRAQRHTDSPILAASKPEEIERLRELVRKVWDDYARVRDENKVLQTENNEKEQRIDQYERSGRV